MKKMQRQLLCVIFTNGLLILNLKKTAIKLKKLYLQKSVNRSIVKCFYFNFNSYITIPLYGFLFFIINYYTSTYLFL